MFDPVFLGVSNQPHIGDRLLELLQPAAPSAVEIDVLLLRLHIEDYERRLAAMERRSVYGRSRQLARWAQVQFQRLRMFLGW